MMCDFFLCMSVSSTSSSLLFHISRISFSYFCPLHHHFFINFTFSHISPNNGYLLFLWSTSSLTPLNSSPLFFLHVYTISVYSSSFALIYPQLPIIFLILWLCTLFISFFLDFNCSGLFSNALCDVSTIFTLH